MTNIKTMAAVLLLLASVAQAEPGWDGKVGLGYLATSGNSETTNASLYADGEYSTTRWHHGLSGLIMGAESNSQSTAERYEAAYQAKYDMREFDYLFGLLDFQKDKFSGVDEQTSEVFGYGRRFLKTETRKWNGEIGVGAKQITFRDLTEADETIVRLATDYWWKFSEAGEFKQVLTVEAGSDNTYLESVSSVSSRLMDSLALVASFTLKNNSDVPIGTDKSDTFTSISLEYAF